MFPSYDTVNFWLPIDNLTEHHLEKILSTLVNVTTTQSNQWGNTFSGTLGNLKVTLNQTSNRIWVRGSLCKFYHGDNLQSLALQEVKPAIEMISDHLHLPMEQAQVGRFDIACNFKMDHKVSLYLPPLGIKQYYKRLEQPNSLYYQNSKGELIFYDKVKELKAHKVKIPEQVKNENWLRYEQRYMRQVNKTLLKQVTTATLGDEYFYRDMVKRWGLAYESISKDRKLNLHAIGLNIIDNLTEMGGIALLQAYGGERAAMEAVDQQRTMGKYSATQVKRVKDKIKYIASQPGFTTENEQVEELNRKVLDIIKNIN